MCKCVYGCIVDLFFSYFFICYKGLEKRSIEVRGILCVMRGGLYLKRREYLDGLLEWMFILEWKLCIYYKKMIGLLCLFNVFVNLIVVLKFL